MDTPLEYLDYVDGHKLDQNYLREFCTVLLASVEFFEPSHVRGRFVWMKPFGQDDGESSGVWKKKNESPKSKSKLFDRMMPKIALDGLKPPG